MNTVVLARVIVVMAFASTRTRIKSSLALVTLAWAFASVRRSQFDFLPSESRSISRSTQFSQRRHSMANVEICKCNFILFSLRYDLCERE